MSSFEVHGDLVVVREENTNHIKSRFFIKTTTGEKPVHLSALRGNIVREIIFNKGRVEYVLNKSLVTGPVELYEAVLLGNNSYTSTYKLQGDRVEYLGRNSNPPQVSSGYLKVDELVDEIVSYRRIWSSVICGEIDSSIEYYRVFLTADLGLNYALFRRLKEAWLELSSEYIGFMFSLIHSLLRDSGFKVVDEGPLLNKCSMVHGSLSVTWRNTVVDYANQSSNYKVAAERMINGVTPDLVISSSSMKIVIECKQGPPKTWLLKAIKQAKRYRELAQRLILVTNKKLNSDEHIELSKYYDGVIDECNGEKYYECMNMLKEIISPPPPI